MNLASESILALDPDTAVAELDSVIAGLGSETGTVANGDTLLAAFAKINDRATVATTTSLLTTITAHAVNVSNPHLVTKAQVGLTNVEDTALSTWAGSSNLTTLGTLTERLTINNSTIGNEALIARAASGQTADIFSVQDSSSNNFVSITSSGQVNIGYAAKATTTGIQLNAAATAQVDIQFAHAGSTKWLQYLNGSGNDLSFYDSSDRFKLHNAVGATINGSTSLGSLTVYGHSASDEAMVVRAASNTPSANPVTVQKSGGGHLFSVNTRTTGGISIGELGAPSKEAHVFAQYAQTDPSGDHMGVYMNEYAVLTSNGSPSLRGVWVENGSARADTGITWSGPAVIGFYGTQYVNTASHQGTIADQYGARMATGISACGTGGAVTNAYSFYSEVLNTDADGTITNGYGLYITNSQTTGTITNRYGIYVTQGSATDMVNHLDGDTTFEGGVGVNGASVPAQAAHISDPSGGATQDAEARTAINSILTVLENIGFTATS